MQKKKSNISFMLFTFNEEKRVGYAVRNFIAYGDVYILDGGSTDATQQIAESLGAIFLRRPENKANSETQKNLDFIRSVITTEYVYWGYVDNIAPKTLVEKMVLLAEERTYKLIKLPMYTYLWGDTSAYALRSDAPFLFHKDYIDLSNNHIHGFGKFLGTEAEEITLPSREEYAIKHFSTYNSSKFMMGHLRYAEAEALEKFEKGKRFGLARMVLAMVGYVWIYGRHCYKLGTLGFLIVLHYATFRLMAYTKLFELEKGITLESIEDAYSKKKEVLLKEFV